jgi:hypothetical protein
MHALIVTTALLAVLIGSVRPAAAQVPSVRVPMPRMALSMALDWKNMLTARPKPPVVQSSIRRRHVVPQLSMTSVVQARNTSVSLVYDQLQNKVMRWVQPRKDFAPELLPYVNQPRVRSLSAQPIGVSGGFGLAMVIETDSILK